MLYESKPLVGVVYAPHFGWMFSAASGNGATLNGLPLKNRAAAPLQESVIGISFGSQDRVIEQMEAVAAKLIRQAKKIRMLGATGLDLVQVAKGAISGLVQLNVHIWDFAAARLILLESGTAFEASPNALGGWQILAAPQPLFDQLKRVVHSALDKAFLPSP
jgi:fructose-1,6-bisphosphatase/inositol monophosphatase family enzyme